MKTNTAHYEKYKNNRPELYNRFNTIKMRCQNPNAVSYYRYGAKGIKCEWRTFWEFQTDMYESYLKHVSKYGKENTQIDRIDSAGNYSKENCRWATRSVNSTNRRNIKLFEFNGKKQTLTAWSKEIGISFFTLYTRIYREKWPLESAFSSKKRINQYV